MTLELGRNFCSNGGETRPETVMQRVSDHLKPLGLRRLGQSGIAGGQDRLLAQGEVKIEGVIGGQLVLAAQAQHCSLPGRRIQHNAEGVDRFQYLLLMGKDVERL